MLRYKSRKKILLITIFICCFIACEKSTEYKKIINNPESFLQVSQKLTDVIVYDIFSPPVASRVYAYPNIAAYETMIQGYPKKYNSLAFQLNGLDSIPSPPPHKKVNFNLAAIHAFLTTGKALIFSETELESYRKQFYEKLDENGISDELKENSIEYGEKVAEHILKWADGDMYKQTRTYPKYSVQRKDSLWTPTPPDYMEGIEPHWDKIRPMTLDSARQYPPQPPANYSMDLSSEFYGQLLEVKNIGDNLSEEETAIAKFWDCNPYVSHHQGHAMFATKKITPGGHWMGITSIATRKSNKSFDETIEAHTLVSIALFDGFIGCWGEKWRSLVVRPETLIAKYLDENWTPLLQTPPFPEYTSGHSVISRAAAITLTDIFGENFSYRDTVEVAYGLPERSYQNFLEASEEAAISRLYGGIHYRMAVENGVSQGENIGIHVVERLSTRKNL